MKFYENRQDFIDVIIATAKYYNISPAIVEKDFFVTVLLKNLIEYIPGILFKGGTCLSKCFNAIERFSEDIDLTLDVSHYTQRNKREANKALILVCDKLGMNIQNRQIVMQHSHGNYNCYNIEYPYIFSEFGLKPYIKVEMTFIQRSYPDIDKSVNTLMRKYLMSINKCNLINSFGIDSFDIKVQTLERTFVDKVFAICDYYLRNEVDRQSRHIYDIYKLTKIIDWKNQQNLINEVRQDRMLNKLCVSADPQVSISKVLSEIIMTDFYKKDYENITSVLLNEIIPYDLAIESISEIVDESLFN